jgi:hypothetical protein
MKPFLKENPNIVEKTLFDWVCSEIQEEIRFVIQDK